MSLYRRKICCLLPTLFCLILAGCGFQPVYGTASGASEKSPIRAGVKVSTSASGAVTATNNSVVDNNATANMARQFTNNLEDMLNYEGTPTYKLDVALSQSVVGIGVARDGTASRYNLVLNSTYKLIRIADGKEVDSGSFSNFTSYNNPNNQYFSTYVSEQDARKRGIKELAELYRHRLISFTEKTTPPTPLATNGVPDKLALAKKREGMDTEKTSVQQVHDVFEGASFRADLKPK
jgi:LPS-assembly lipoprotein